jgi:two-component system sensor histidine kinase MprB
VILFAVGLLGAALVIAFVRDSLGPSPGDALDPFLEHWSGGRDGQAADHTDDPRAAAAALAANRRGVDGARLRAEKLDLSEEGDTARARVRVTWMVPGIGRYGYETRVPLGKVDGDWRVRWTPALVHPQLGGGERLGTTRDVPERAPILDRAGRPIMEERPVKRVGAVVSEVDDPRATASGLAEVLGVDARRLLRQIRGGGRQQFVEAIVLRPQDYAALEGVLSSIAVARAGTGAYYTDIEVRGTPLRMYVRPARSGQALLAARSLSEVDSALSRLGWSLAITCLAGIALAALVGALVARGALRPVRTLTATAERITDTHDLGERIETEGDDELGRLGTTFNAMLDSLEGAIRSQRQLVSDASHELRTPLTSLRTNIDLLRQGVTLSDRDRQRLLRDVTRELEELTTLVANIVELARGSQRDLHLEHARLDELAEHVVQRAEARFPSLEFALEADETTVWGDPEALERALWNLVENAAKWSNGGGRVDLTVVGGELTVRDHGPGVPAADRPFIFDRFYRSDTARGQPGSGLGLAIVSQIAESHGGRVEVEDAEGGGARFRLVLLRA